MGFILDKKYYRNNIQLAIPVITANAGQALVGIVDNLMVGRLGAIELAAASLGGIIIMNVLVFGMGVAMSLTPLAGKSFAVGDYKKTATLFQNSISLNAIIGVLLTVFLFMLSPFLSLMGQPKEVIEVCRPFYYLVSLSIFPFMLFLSFKHFMEGIGNTKVAMIITISANILNIILNYLLIYGKFGFPEMGVSGAALATLISRLMMPIMFAVYIYRNRSVRRFLYFFSLKNLSVKRHKNLLKVGLPISVQMVIEIFALSFTAIMMGWISAEALAANQIVLSIMSFMFMIACGVSGAVTILVSHECGRRNTKDIIGYTKAGIQMSALFMFFAAIFFVLFGKYIAMAFSTDAEVIAIASKIFLVAALFEVSDGIQVTALGALRGMTDVNKPMFYAILAYLIINVPLAYLFGFTFGLGPQGIWIGFLCGLTTAGILFIRRFRYKVRMLGY